MVTQLTCSTPGYMSSLGLAVGEERKRMGQFFTGTRVARLLATLSDASSAKRIIDPMAGTGDMLAACLEIGSEPEKIAAIDIDSRVLIIAEQRLRTVGTSPVILALSAFLPAVWRQAGDAWDLVITNPPYVRYQRNSWAQGDLPDAAQVRRGLVQCIEAAHHLDTTERNAFLNTARNYSGLSDLAVPSWILCMAQVSLGGRVAMLVPNTWLSRKYASPVSYLLQRFFDLEFVVEDGDASWFDHALVRTTLVVAKRAADKGTAPVTREHLHVLLTRTAGNADCVVARAVEGLSDTGTTPELRFVRMLHEGSVDGRPGVTVRRTTHGRIAASGSSLEADGDGVLILPNVIAEATRASRLSTLRDLGWTAGQGLRTGANDFFYLTGSGGRFLSTLLPGQLLDLPVKALRPAIFKQSELNEQLVLQPQRAISWVLDLAGFVHPDDISRDDSRTVMTGDLLRLVNVGSSTTYERQGTQRPLPSLSAVAPNVRKRGPDGLPTFWYHLPRFTDRHKPAVAIPRINGRTPRWRVNPNRVLLVDANFTGLWPAAPGAVPAEAVAMLLASSWAMAWFEAACTVMGGGALKVEATDLSRMPFPFVPQEAYTELATEGRRLLEGVVNISDAAYRVADILGYGPSEESLRIIVAKKQTIRGSR